MDLQKVIVFILFSVALLWLGVRFYKTYSSKKQKVKEGGKACGKDQCGCG